MTQPICTQYLLDLIYANPKKMVEATLLPLTLIGIVILIAIFLSIAAKKAGQNATIGFILAGFILGPFVLKILHPTDPVVIAFSELGLFVLLFYLGLELSWKEFIEAGSSGFGLALIDMLASTIVGFAIANYLKSSIDESKLKGKDTLSAIFYSS